MTPKRSVDVSVWSPHDRSFLLKVGRQIFKLEGELNAIWALIDGVRSSEDIFLALESEINKESLIDALRFLKKRNLISFI